MEQTWWVRPEQLDEDQQAVISLPLRGSYYISGPPGSGKSNLLLLRANYLSLAGYLNIALLVFTRSLREFLVMGAEQYAFDSSKILTYARWQLDLLREYGLSMPATDDLDRRRELFLKTLNMAMESGDLGVPYEALLVDEAQDYTSEELALLRKLCKHIFLVGDLRQRIHSGRGASFDVANVVDQVSTLKYHYRNGVKICRVADKIGEGFNDGIRLSDTANYNEAVFPSSVVVNRLPSIESQVDAIVESLSRQLVAYPEGFLGVLCPRREDFDAVSDHILKSTLGPLCIRQSSSEGYVPFERDKRICLCTLHSAKGLEFRAVHIAAAEGVKRFDIQRRLSYVGVTRARTSLSVYHSDPLPGFLAQALAAADNVRSTPGIESLFGGGSNVGK